VSRVLDTGTGDLLAECEDGVVVVTLNRPQRRNALSDAMLRGLAHVLVVCEEDPAVRCIILTGAGGAFCSGGDVKAFAEVGAVNVGRGAEVPLHEQIEAQRRLQRATAGRLYGMPKPTIACVEGAAAGAGLGLALACDLRVASANAIFVTAFARVGLSGDYGVTWFLPRMLGKARAMELMLFSERVDAARACELGLVNWTTAPGGALSRARELASSLAAGSSVAQRAIKDNLTRAVDSDLLTCMDLEVTEAMRCAATQEHVDAIAALVKRA
jgi:2-(1,2-epoxy-1,2-dihydrophenyl)acetyl-CoA isomerase